jgi:hypothetical protein
MKRKQMRAMHNAKNLPLHLEESEEDEEHSSLDSFLRLPLFFGILRHRFGSALHDDMKCVEFNG